MKQPLFTGACTALVTPFLNGKINYPMLQQLIQRQIDAGVKAIVLAGTTGEAPTLSDQEKLELFEKGKHYANGNAMIIAGTGANCTEHAVHLSCAAEASGADALLVVTPYYNKANPEGLYAHYLSIAHAVKIPLIIYNVPSRTGLDIPIGVCQRLSRIPNIVGIKEANPDITRITKLRKACADDFTIWSGNDDQAVAAMALGAKGLISVISNLLPAKTGAMCQAALAGDFDTASDLQCNLQQLCELMFCEVNPIPVKAAMQMIGFDCGQCRLPLGRLSPANTEKLTDYFKH